MFVGRKNELQSIREIYKSQKFEFACIYGVRRIGKTFFLKESIKDIGIKSLYYEFNEDTLEINLKKISEEYYKTFNEYPKTCETFEKFFEYMFQKSLKEAFVFILDEFPILLKDSKVFQSLLKNMIDKYKEESKMKLVISGSAFDIMNDLMSYNSPLYGRFTYALILKPLNYLESSLFYKNYSNEDKVKMFSAFGGNPFYNALIDPKLSVEENIIKLFFIKNFSLINNSLQNLIYLEVGKLSNAYQILSAINKGMANFNKILNYSNIKYSVTLDLTVEKLINIGLIKKNNPINDNNKKRTFYSLSDNALSFYMTYIFASDINEEISIEDYFAHEVKDDFLSRYVPLKFEGICKEYLLLASKNNLIENKFSRIGKYFYNDKEKKENGEFDVVTFNGETYDFYECKFKDGIIPKNEVDKEINQIKRVGFSINDIFFITKKGIEEGSKAKSISLDELFDEKLYKCI